MQIEQEIHVDRDRHAVYVYIDNEQGQTIGRVSLYEYGGERGLWGVETSKEYRGRGIATFACATAILRSLEVDPTNDHFMLMASSHPHAVATYEKLGFLPVPLDYETAMTRMELDITPITLALLRAAQDKARATIAHAA